MSQATKARCSVCGVTSTYVGAFIQHRAEFDKTRLYCPRCWQGKTSNDHHGVVAVWLIYLVFTVTLLIISPHHFATQAMVNFSWFQVCLLIAIVPHEFGHAFAARWMGHRVFHVILGTAKTLWRGRLLGFDVVANVLPINGAVITLPPNVAGYRRKKFLIVLAGPLTNAILFLLSLVVLYPRHFSSSAIGSGHFEGWEMFALANLAILFFNVLPHNVNTPWGILPSDGKQLLQLLFRPQGKAEAAHAAWYLFEATTCKEQNRRAEAREWLERGLTTYPQDHALRTHYADALFNAGDFRAARHIFVSLSEQIHSATACRALLRSDIALIDVLLEEDALLEEADAYSAEALAAFPWNPRIQTARGAVLAALRRFSEALAILHATAQATRDKREIHAEAVCFLAIAEAGMGNRAVVEKLRERARSIVPNCYLLPRVEAALQVLAIVEFQAVGRSAGLRG